MSRKAAIKQNYHFPRPRIIRQLKNVTHRDAFVVLTDFNQADQLFFDQIVEAAMTDEGLRQAAVVNPSDKFELVFKHLLESLFVERMDQNEEIFVRFMNDAPFQRVVTSWMAAEAYRRLRGSVAEEGVVEGTARTAAGGGDVLNE